jgi:hypothetical protein
MTPGNEVGGQTNDSGQVNFAGTFPQCKRRGFAYEPLSDFFTVGGAEFGVPQVES